MKNKNIILMIIVLLIFTILFFRNIIGALIFHSEKITKTEITAMIKSRFTPDRIVEIKTNVKKYIIPLPMGASRYNSQTYPGGNQYLVPIGGSMTYYLNITLPLNGWQNYDRAGAEYILRSKSGKEYMYIIVDAFTAFYSRITIQVSNPISNQQN